MAKVIIDIGHFNCDSGAVANGFREVDLNQNICYYLNEALERSGVETKFATGELIDRVNLANSYNPDLFVSVHNNAGGGRGTEVFCYKFNTDSERAANLVHDSIISNNLNLSRGVKEGNLMVLRETTCAAILVECAFVDNLDDLNTINTEEKRKAFGEAIASGVTSYLSIPFVQEEQAEESTEPSVIVINEVQVFPVLPEYLEAEQYYVDNNPDISVALYNKQIPSGHWHYEVAGRNEGRPSIFDETTKKLASSSSDGTPIIGPATASKENVIKWAMSKNTDPEYIHVMELVWTMANEFDINPVFACAMVTHETGALYVNGSAAGLNKDYHNPCGLKVTQGGGDYDSNAHRVFPSWVHGLSAYFDHLNLYLGINKYPLSSGETFDPRHFPYLKGTVKYVEDLSGKWCPSSEYASKILKHMEDIKNI